VVNPYPKGSFPPSDAPSFAWRTNGLFSRRRFCSEPFPTRTKFAQNAPLTRAEGGRLELGLAAVAVFNFTYQSRVH
jgi:hypothetical protein